MLTPFFLLLRARTARTAAADVIVYENAKKDSRGPLTSLTNCPCARLEGTGNLSICEHDHRRLFVSRLVKINFLVKQ